MAFDLHETVLNLREAYDDIHNSCDEYDVDFEFDEVLDVANGYDNKDQFIAALSVAADERGVELPDEWWSCIVEDYTPQQKLFAEIAPAMKDRQGGYTRIVKLGARKGDAAEMCILQWVTAGEAAPAPAAEEPAKEVK